ncbi:hypothetical protein [Moorena producens]|nr:hypothetical protein [Moorena producens]
MQSLMGGTPKTALHRYLRCLFYSKVPIALRAPWANSSVRRWA